MYEGYQDYIVLLVIEVSYHVGCALLFTGKYFRCACCGVM